MEHYYTADPSAPHEYRQVTLALGDRVLTFTTDAGVFSRDEVDFGTRLMIDSLPPLSGRVLDLGCGWGGLSLPLAALYPMDELVCADVNRRALELCRRNAKALGVPAQILESDGFTRVEGRFDAIVTNPPIRAGIDVYYPWFAQSFDRLVTGGSFYCVVQKKQGAPSVKAELTRVYSNCRILARKSGYWILAAVKEAHHAPAFPLQ
jgi:16S rRNA (guanine1207-N2)-methyltransferase